MVNISVFCSFTYALNSFFSVTFGEEKLSQSQAANGFWSISGDTDLDLQNILTRQKHEHCSLCQRPKCDTNASAPSRGKKENVLP